MHKTAVTVTLVLIAASNASSLRTRFAVSSVFDPVHEAQSQPSCLDVLDRCEVWIVGYTRGAHELACASYQRIGHGDPVFVSQFR